MLIIKYCKKKNEIFLIYAEDKWQKKQRTMAYDGKRVYRKHWHFVLADAVAKLTQIFNSM